MKKRLLALPISLMSIILLSCTSTSNPLKVIDYENHDRILKSDDYNNVILKLKNCYNEFIDNLYENEDGTNVLKSYDICFNSSDESSYKVGTTKGSSEAMGFYSYKYDKDLSVLSNISYGYNKIDYPDNSENNSFSYDYTYQIDDNNLYHLDNNTNTYTLEMLYDLPYICLEGEAEYRLFKEVYNINGFLEYEYTKSEDFKSVNFYFNDSSDKLIFTIVKEVSGYVRIGTNLTEDAKNIDQYIITSNSFTHISETKSFTSGDYQGKNTKNTSLNNMSLEIEIRNVEVDKKDIKEYKNASGIII